MRTRKLGRSPGKTVLTVFFTIISVIYILPVVAVVLNSFKLNTFVKTDTFGLPNAESFAGFDNFIKGMTFGNYPFLQSVSYSLVITVLSLEACSPDTSPALILFSRSARAATMSFASM